MEKETDPGGLERTDAARFKIEELLAHVRTGQIRIPEFQRGLKWGAPDVERLFDSIYRGFPIGTLLFWERPAPAQRVRLGPLSVEAPELSGALWVVDGQQRITSLAAALLPGAGASADPRFDLEFDLATERFVRAGSGSQQTRIPLREAHDLQRVLSWLRDRDLPEELQDRAFRLADRLRNYEIPAYIVRATDEDALRQIFDRINTFGKRMTRAEVFHALHASTADSGDDLKSLGEEVGDLGFGRFDDNTLLFCVMGVRHHDVLRDIHREFDGANPLENAIEEARLAIRRAIDFLRQDARVPHYEVIPYQYLTVGVVRFFALHPEPSEWNRILLRRWFWRAAATGPISRLGATGTLRATSKAIVDGDATKSVLGLLELVSDTRPPLDVGLYRWKNADARLGVCALASLRPQTLFGEAPIDTTATIDVAGRDALLPIVPPSVHDLAKTLANRLFVDVLEDASDSRVSEEEVVNALIQAPSETLETHCLDKDMVRLLAEGRAGVFLERRTASMSDLIRDFVDALAEWERPARPSIDDLSLIHG